MAESFQKEEFQAIFVIYMYFWVYTAGKKLSVLCLGHLVFSGFCSEQDCIMLIRMYICFTF